MSSRAVKQFRAKNPTQHLILTSMATSMLAERQKKPYRRNSDGGLGMTSEEVEEEGRGRQKRRGAGKRVTWSSSLLHFRSISPRVSRPSSGIRYPSSPYVFHRSPSPPAPVTARVTQEPTPFDWRPKTGTEMETEDRTTEEDTSMSSGGGESWSNSSSQPSGPGSWRSIPISRLDLRLDLSCVLGDKGGSWHFYGIFMAIIYVIINNDLILGLGQGAVSLSFQTFWLHWCLRAKERD